MQTRFIDLEPTMRDNYYAFLQFTVLNWKKISNEISRSKNKCTTERKKICQVYIFSSWQSIGVKNKLPSGLDDKIL